LQTKKKLADLEKRLADLVKRSDLSAVHAAEVRRSCERMIRQYRREIKLYEAYTSSRNPPSATSS
jgi:hypothetical protein